MSKKIASKKASRKSVKIHAEVLPKTGTDRAEEAVAQAVIDDATPAAPDDATKPQKTLKSKAELQAERAAAKAAKTPKTPEVAKEPRKPGILAIAADILAKTKKAMTAKEIVDHALENKMWETNGATPGATLYSALIRDVAKKGSESRFMRAEKKGMFCAAGK